MSDDMDRLDTPEEQAAMFDAWAAGDGPMELQAELDELERTDPAVARAAQSYDRMVERMTGRTLQLPGVDHADALEWLAALSPGCATAAIFDPPYAVGTPVRGREDGAAGSVFGPLSFMSRTLALTARALRPGGVALIFGDWRRMPDLGYIASTVGLRPAATVAWVRNRPGTGGLFRASWDPIMVVSRGVPDAINRAAIRNVVVADYPTKRRHPYEKPVEVYTHILARVARTGDLVIDPFAGAATSRTAALELGLRWMGCDIDPAFAEAS